MGPVVIQYDDNLTFTESREWFVANDPANQGNSSPTGTTTGLCTSIVATGTCDITAWVAPTGGSNRLLVVIATVDSNSGTTPSITSIVAGNLGGTTDPLLDNSGGTTVTASGGNDHVISVRYLHENSWNGFDPTSSSANDIRLTVGGATSDVTLTALIISDVDSSGTVVGTPATATAVNWPATSSYTPASTTNVVVVGALGEATGQTESESNLTNLNAPVDNNELILL